VGLENWTPQAIPKSPVWGKGRTGETIPKQVARGKREVRPQERCLPQLKEKRHKGSSTIRQEENTRRSNPEGEDRRDELMK